MRSQRSKFSLAADAAYLNCAYQGPLLRAVEKIGQAAVARKSKPYEVFSTDFFEGPLQLKTAFSKLINSTSDDIAIVPSVSHAMASVAKNLKPKKGGNIVLPRDEFPSNVYPWLRWAAENDCEIRWIGPEKGQNRTISWNKNLLAGIDSKTVLVACGHVHWADGTLFDLEKLGAACRENDAFFVVDATQSMGVLPFDVQKIRPDAVVAAGYKWLLGPYGMGCAYFSNEKMGDGAPVEENWINRRNAEDFKNLVNYEAEYKAGAARFSMGEQSNFILIPMLTASIEQLLDWSPAAIQLYAKKIGREPLAALEAMGVGFEKSADRAHHLVGARLDEHLFDTEKLSEKLAAARVFVSFRGTAMRISMHVWNDEKELWRLVECVAAARR